MASSPASYPTTFFPSVDLETSNASDARSEGQAAAMVFMIILMALIWSSAGLMVVAVYRSKNIRQHYECWYLLSIAVAILISGLVYPMSLGASVLRYAVAGKSDFHSPDECFAVNAVFSVYRMITCLSVFFMALERYVTILKPLTFCYILTEKRIKASVGVTWAFTFALLAVMLGLKMAYPVPEGRTCDINNDFQVWRVNLAQSTLSALLYLLVVAVYVHLHVIARRHLRVIEEERRMFGLERYQKNLKRTGVAFKITVFILVLEVPLFAFNYLRISSTEHADLTRYSDYMFFLSVLRQLLQPAFYALVSADFRRSLLAIFRRRQVAPKDVPPYQVLDRGGGGEGAFEPQRGRSNRWVSDDIMANDINKY